MKILLIMILCFFTSTTYANDASVTIIASGSWQVIKVFSSISDLNTGTNPITTLIADDNGEAIYYYNTDTQTKVYIKAELSDTIDEWGTSEYLLNPGSNSISLWIWWSLSSLVSELDEIKWSWFIVWVHSLSSHSEWAISASDKNDIANLVREKLESAGSLLDQIWSQVVEILTRVFSIKWDTLKIF